MEKWRKGRVQNEERERQRKKKDIRRAEIGKGLRSEMGRLCCPYGQELGESVGRGPR